MSIYENDPNQRRELRMPVVDRYLMCLMHQLMPVYTAISFPEGTWLFVCFCSVNM